MRLRFQMFLKSTEFTYNDTTEKIDLHQPNDTKHSDYREKKDDPMNRLMY
ncbi:MAG: hypothetical protein JXB20_04995 [Bacilli bacterium]|nr:hypothetical protein [Bacilli bacterium]